jgi:hypothetical protein
VETPPLGPINLFEVFMPRRKKVIDPVSEQTVKSDFNFFTEADLNREGQIGAMVPSWSCYQLIDDLERDIRQKELDSQDYSIPSERRAILIKELNERKERLEMAKVKPRLDKDKIFRLVGKDRQMGQLGEKISESMFSYDDMKRGIPEAAVECSRMLDPCIKLDPQEQEVASGCNVNIVDGKVSRDDAIRVWRYGRLYLEEMSNPEILRK